MQLKYQYIYFQRFWKKIFLGEIIFGYKIIVEKNKLDLVLKINKYVHMLNEV